MTNNWNCIEKEVLLIDRNITPFIYGRHLQVLLDYYKSNTEGRKYQIHNDVKKMTTKEIILNAQQLVETRKKNMLDKQQWGHTINDNGFYNLMVDHPNIFADSDENIYLQKYINKPLTKYADAIYIGRCFQFLLDTDRVNYKLDDLLKFNGETIILNAHCCKITILKRSLKNKVFDVDCGCDDDCESHQYSDCSWTYDDSRCACGNRRYCFDELPIKSIDDTEIFGYPEPM